MEQESSEIQNPTPNPECREPLLCLAQIEEPRLATLRSEALPAEGSGPGQQEPLSDTMTRGMDHSAQSQLAGTSGSAKKTRMKKMKKSIYVSYSPDAGFLERKFVMETVHQLKENSLAEDIWFDKDEGVTDSPSWFSARMEAVERCRAAVLFLSDSYFACPVSVYEGKTLLERHGNRSEGLTPRCYPVLYNLSADTEIPKSFSELLTGSVDLTKEYAKHSLAEKTSVVVGALMMDLERHASIRAAPPLLTPPDSEPSGEYRKKKICQWSVADLQEWLFKLGIKEFYRQSLAEYMVDGFLLMSISDQDMTQHLGIDSRAVRKKIMQQILATLDKEHQLPDNWHLRARTQRPKPSTAYLIYDPTDVRLAQNVKADLTSKGLNIVHHNRLGQSKEEFLSASGPVMATATHVILLLTEHAAASPFTFQEVLFADWLGKRVVTAVFRNMWHRGLRPTLRAVLGDYPAVDFESQMYQEGLSVLQHHLKPLRTLPGVVLEQAYLDKMADGLKPLAVLSAAQRGPSESVSELPRVFVSYHWDVQARAEELRRALESTAAMVCVSDISPVHRSNSSHGGQRVPPTDSDQTQRHIRAAAALVCCITPKYLQTETCVKDLTTADLHHRPIVPAMLRFCPWPPEGAPAGVRKILARCSPVDLSNDKLYRQNLTALVDRVRKITGGGAK